MISAFPRLPLLADRGRFLGLAGAEIIQLRATGAAFLLHFDFSDARGMNREHAFDAFAIGNSANSKSLVQSAPFSSDHDAKIGRASCRERARSAEVATSYK